MKAKPTTIVEYNNNLDEVSQSICDLLRQAIGENLDGATSILWHGHPVWFINDNPVVGYAKLKDSVQLLFWSGQSFDEPGLKSEGSFKAAQARYTEVNQINLTDLRRWLNKSKSIQWDYKNIVKRRGVLERITV